MLQHHYEPHITTYTLTTSHHRCRQQGSLHTNWRSRHRRRRPPSTSSSATAAIIAITGLVVAWCRLIPSSSSSLSSTAAATVLLPPCDPPPPLPSRPLRPLDRPWRCHEPACGVDALPVQRVECRSRPTPPLLGGGPIAPAPPSRPPQCLGLSGGRR